MKKGDVVKVFDGSYSMMKENGVLAHTSGNVLIADGEYEVIKVADWWNRFPTDYSYTKGQERNNLELCCIRNPDRIVYIQSRFCSKVDYLASNRKGDGK